MWMWTVYLFAIFSEIFYSELCLEPWGCFNLFPKSDKDTQSNQSKLANSWNYWSPRLRNDKNIFVHFWAWQWMKFCFYDKKATVLISDWLPAVIDKRTCAQSWRELSRNTPTCSLVCRFRFVVKNKSHTVFHCLYSYWQQMMTWNVQNCAVKQLYVIWREVYIYDEDHMSELWIKNRRERDLRSCEVTQAVTNKAQLLVRLPRSVGRASHQYRGGHGF